MKIGEVELFNHQAEAYERYKDKDEIALFFEMGCGKSLTTLAIAAYKFQNGMISSLLIIAPNDVHRQWADEQCQWLSKMGVKYEVQCLGGRGGEPKLKPFATDKSECLHIVTVNIDTFSTPDKWEQVVQWADEGTMMVLDEATAIKNIDSNRTQRLLYEFNDKFMRGNKIVKTQKVNKCRAVLTGTPITNGQTDLWAIMEFIKPNFFGRNWQSFRRYYGLETLPPNQWRSYPRTRYKNSRELRSRLNSVATFRKLSECADMPEQTYVTRELEMTPEIRKVYERITSECAAEYDGHISYALNALARSVRQQQASSGFVYGRRIDGDADDIMPQEAVWIKGGNPKLEALLRDVDESDKPVIILTRYTAEAERIYNELCGKYSTCLITGWRREGSIDGFKEGKYDVMVANTACIARGFNLQISHTVLFYSNTFSMELREQAEFRTFRLGQKQKCVYIDYVYRNSVDEDIINALAAKKDLLEYFREKEDGCTTRERTR